jgi:hypothetical protein
LLKCFQIADAAHVFLQMISLPLVNRRRHMVWLSPMDCCHQTIFRRHVSLLGWEMTTTIKLNSTRCGDL